MRYGSAAEAGGPERRAMAVAIGRVEAGKRRNGQFAWGSGKCRSGDRVGGGGGAIPLRASRDGKADVLDLDRAVSG